MIYYNLNQQNNAKVHDLSFFVMKRDYTISDHAIESMYRILI